MKVVHLSTYESSGGAASAACRLHHGLLAGGVDSCMLVKNRNSADETVHELPSRMPEPLWKRLIRERLARSLRERRCRDGRPDEIFHDIRSEFRPADFHKVLGADIVHLHWTCGLLDWPTTLPWLVRQKPLVWSFHDMHSILGVMNYRAPDSLPEAFAKWEDQVLHEKCKLLRDLPADRLHVIAPSRWMERLACASPAFSRFPVHHIPTGLCTDTFKPVDKETARKALGLPAGRKMIGFIAQNLADRRKGLKVLLKALHSLDGGENKPVLVTAGGTRPEISGVDSIHLGAFDGEKLLSLFYNVLDLFICPSLQDNLPNTVIEAMSCGVPVLAFNTGGIPDMVRPGQTGWLVDGVGNASQLTATIAKALDDPAELSWLGTSCRTIAEREYASAQQAGAVVEVYQALLESVAQNALIQPPPGNQ